MDERKLFSNTFINKDVYNVKDNTDKYLKEQEEFKRFIENKNPDIGNINFVTASQEKSNIIDKSETLIDMIEEGKQLINNNEYKKYINFIKNKRKNNIQLRKQYITIDSSKRNKILYPNSNNYKIKLENTFDNVKSIKLKKTDFPNIEQTINKSIINNTNNKIHFALFKESYQTYLKRTPGVADYIYVNIYTEDDFKAGSFIKYTATLQHGTYTFEGLAKELERAMNYEIQKEGTNSEFSIIIDVDSQFEILVFNCYKSKAVGNSLSFGTDGATTTANYIDIKWKNHNLELGDIIQLLNVNTDTFPTFYSSPNNPESVNLDDYETIYKVIGVESTDVVRVVQNFYYGNTDNRLTLPNAEDYILIGGKTIEARAFRNLEIYFDITSNLSSLLGFPNNIITERIIVEDIFPVSRVPSLVLGGGGSGNDPDFDYDLAEKILNFIDSPGGGLSNNNIFIGSVNLNYILSSDDGLRTIINTTSNHNLSTGDRVLIEDEAKAINIYNEDSTITGITSIAYFHTYLDGVSYIQPTPKDGLNASLRDDFTEDITRTYGYLVDVIDNRNFSIPLKYIDYEIEDPDNSGEYILISNYIIREMVGVTAENRGTILLSSRKTLNIDGEEYLYMLSEKIGGNFFTSKNSELLENCYAKIQLTTKTETDKIYDSFVGGQKYYYDTPLSSLRDIDFQFRDSNGNLFDFNNLDHNFTLEIIEVIQKIEGSDYNSRLGNKISI